MGTVELSMGLEMELDSKRNFKVSLSPNTVLPSHHPCSNVEKRNTKVKPKRKDDQLSLKDDFREISFNRYRSVSCKNVPSKPVGLDGNIELKRGSIYQSSKEVRKMKKIGKVEGRRKIELSRSSDTSFSFRIANSLCSLDEESPQKRSPATSLNLNPASFSKPYVEPCSSDGFIEICLNSDKREKLSTEAVERDSIKDLNFRCHQVVGPLNDGSGLLERDRITTLHKSQSAKVGMPHSPSPSESDSSSRASSKARFSPIRKIFDPFMKSKSQRSPLGYVAEACEVKTIAMADMRRNRTLRKSLLHDFSNTAQTPGSDSQFVKKDNHHSVVACSPVHLHGCLKLENKHGVPFFEFSLKSPEDIFVAKTWKTESAFNWVYTFHTIDSRKKSNASGWGSNDSNKESSMVGQMQVSCYLCSELKDGGAIATSMVTEFVLYDIAHARKSVAAQESSNWSPDIVKSHKGSNTGLVEGSFELDDVSDSVKPKFQPNHGSFESPNPYPWAPAVLHPNLEIAAIVIQVPFEKRESLKYKRGDKISDKAHPNLLSVMEQKKGNLTDSAGLGKVKVVIPTGNHGLPSDASRGPSSLLDRWRLGGGCDCGGWDMACPLIVFGNPCIQCAEDQPLIENQRPLELLVQGTKENTPALTMKVVDKGQYAVDFHAQLSTLQAFSICVAILHGTEVSTAAGQERSKQLTQSNSLKVLIEEEVRFLIEAVTEEEKSKVVKTLAETPPSYVLNPPFSPIARV